MIIFYDDTTGAYRGHVEGFENLNIEMANTIRLEVGVGDDLDPLVREFEDPTNDKAPINYTASIVDGNIVLEEIVI